MKRLEGENGHAEGSPAESKITGVVSGETESKEWTEEQDKEVMARRIKEEDRREAEWKAREEEARKALGDWDEETQEMEIPVDIAKGNELLRSLDDLQERYGNQDEIAEAFKDASAHGDPEERLSKTIENMRALSKRLHEEGSIFGWSRRRRVDAIIGQLEELK